MVISLSQWLTSLKRHWLLSGIAFGAVGLLTVYIILFGTREYRSVSRLLLRIGHENGTLDPVTTATGERIAPIHTREDEVETAIGVMQSRTILEEVVKQIGASKILSGGVPDQPSAVSKAEDVAEEDTSSFLSNIKSKLGSIDPIPENETAVRALEKGLNISAPSKSSLISIDYKAKTPELAQEVVRTWVSTYLQHHAKVHRTAGTYDFLLSQDEELQKKLTEIHSEIRKAKNTGGFVTLEGQQKILESQLQNVKLEMQNVAAGLVEAKTRAESYKTLLQNSVEELTTEEVSGIASDARNQMRGVLYQLEILEKEYESKYKEDHPKLKTIREQVANASKIVNAQEAERKQYKQSANPIHQRIRENQVLDIALTDALKDKLLNLEQQQQQLLHDIKQLNSEEETLVTLLRDAAVLEERNRTNAVLLERARLNEVLDENQITSINVVQPASYEKRPITPNKRLCAMMGFVAGVMLALTLPILLDGKQILAAAATVNPNDLVDDQSALQHEQPDQGNALSKTTNGETDSLQNQPIENAEKNQAASSGANHTEVETSSVDSPPTLPR